MIRPIQKQDNGEMTRIIQTVMESLGAIGEGYSINDSEVHQMYEAYQSKGKAYWVIEENNEVIGGAGVGPLEGGNSSYCELKKMYFLEKARGHGLGLEMINRCLAWAKDYGYQTCYLETLEIMLPARKLYEKVGFTYLSEPLGETGHYQCNSYMSRKL